ncbi:cation:proton antiporter [Nakamurella sp. YIM 132087]|uniref:Cation:proton antiporter n=2 Tax=Nakamurella alba TaxID=2665158 RepID=A0A7K1FLN2_9ACTN|nr:cation:proton antiporter [Nakamurella alba]
MALSPLVAALLRRAVAVPLVVIEILLGMLVGPTVLNWIVVDGLLDAVAEFGLAMLFFMAGMEIDFRLIRGRPIRRSAVGWLLSLAGGIVAGVLLASTTTAGIFIGVALCSTALGTLLPILIDTKAMRTPFGTAVTAVGAVGEFGPLLAISIFLSSREPQNSAIVLIAFVVVAFGAIFLAARGKHRSLHGLIAATLHTSGQFAVRLVVLVIAALVTLSVLLGLDMLLGAFAAGVLVQYLLASAPPVDAKLVRSKLDGVAFGVFVPIFFITTGVGFDLRGLLADTSSLVLVPVFLVLLLVVRGLPGLLSAPPGSTGADKRALVLMTATGLPIIVAVTAIGQDDGALAAGTATALIGAGMLSVLLFPLLASTVRRTPTDAQASADH